MLYRNCTVHYHILAQELVPSSYIIISPFYVGTCTLLVRTVAFDRYLYMLSTVALGRKQFLLSCLVPVQTLKDAPSPRPVGF